MSISAVLHRNRRLSAGLLATVAVASLAACGSKDDSSGTTQSPAGDSTNRGPGGGGGGAMSAYFQCLQQNGVTMTRPSGAPGGNGARPSGAPGDGGTPPSGGPRGARPSGGPGGPGGGRAITKPDGVDDDTWTKATEACASLAPSPAPTS